MPHTSIRAWARTQNNQIQLLCPLCHTSHLTALGESLSQWKLEQTWRVAAMNGTERNWVWTHGNILTAFSDLLGEWQDNLIPVTSGVKWFSDDGNFQSGVLLICFLPSALLGTAHQNNWFMVQAVIWFMIRVLPLPCALTVLSTHSRGNLTQITGYHS